MSVALQSIADVHVESVGDGPPLVLLHGFALHGGLFAPIVPALARTHRVHAVDLPGHGHSRASLAALDDLVDAIARVVEPLREPATILGWSLGGMVAQQLALDHPQLVRDLVLVCTTPRFVTAEGWPHAMDPDTLARFGDELRVAYRATLQRFLTLQVQGRGEGGGVDRDVLAQLRDSLFARAVPTADTLAAALSILADTDLRAQVPRIAQRALVITGPRDALTPPAAGEWLAAHIPLARHLSIPGAAHAPFLSHPAAFVAAVQDFTTDVDTSAARRP